MASELAALDPKEVVLVLIGIGGLVPILIHYRRESRWFVIGYGLLVVAALATNLEAFVPGAIMDVIEHGVGLLGSGIVFAAAAYYRRQAVIESDEAATPTSQNG